jgi:hypothetical protein
MSPEATPDRDLVYSNGIDPDTGTYALPPFNVDELARDIRSRQGSPAVMKFHQEAVIRKFAAPFGVDLAKPDEAGWAIVFHEDTPQDVRDALAPLIAHRRQQAGGRFKQMDYKKGEQVRDWYQRYGVSPGNLDPAIVPYYLLLVGPPTGIPFDFQYLVGVEYAVGRLDFNQASDYGRYAQSVVDYEQGQAVNNAKEIVYWGTRHPNDPATGLSTSMLINPLANGLAGSPGSLKKPIHEEVGYRRQLYSAAEATKAQLLSVFTAPTPPALLFTASHGMALKAGKTEQPSIQGGLLCQDWPGYGQVTPNHYLAAADVPDNARVGGLVAFIFACFSAGTPDNDQFLMNLGGAAAAAKLAPQPFVAALPRRLLSHPLGSALAVIGHVDRAWGFSIQPLKATTAQIEVFRNTLGYILTGSPVGHAVTVDFGLRFAALSTELLSAVSPTATPGSQLSDHDLVVNWLERNDAQNYVLLGDPLARIRAEALS